MMKTLYLTTSEKKLFDALSDALREGWEVEDENQTFEDSDAHREMRMRFFRVHDPKLQAFYEDAKKCSNEEELAKLVQDTDLSGVNEGDLMELFFVLGPTPVSRVIDFMLSEATSDKDIEGIAALTVLRNSLLSSLQKQ